MRISVRLDDDLLAECREISGLEAPSAVVTAGMKVLIEREEARRARLLGITERDRKPAGRLPKR